MTEIENRALYIAEQCKAAGMTMAGIAGVLANIEAEGAFVPTNVEDTKEKRVGNDTTYTERVDNGAYHNFTNDAAGYGLAQWTAPDRKASLLAFCKQRGVSIGDFKTQVAFLILEMRGYSRAWNTVTGSSNAYQCGYDVCKYYEICDNLEAASQYRGGRAQSKWYPWLMAAMGSGAQSQIPDTQPAAKDEDGVEVPKTWPPRTIDAHCSGWPEVKLMQAALACRGYTILVDGIWTDEVTAKVKAFQESAGLGKDGVFGPMSWAALLAMDRR